ncbi:cytochrome P450 [Lasiosphaeria miniovina]|uniref:Cytochrome P450 n=1 Tax=Lasiosphaeria miniovina TaxID=1954250 RepID=A0AA40ABL4_9PEZI|nr:cytochrome P450 [Lasiosphaeria miniovina]KAK0712794.1 cytochrome P450 [Lasiosphaeria miniovina]
MAGAKTGRRGANLTENGGSGFDAGSRWTFRGHRNIHVTGSWAANETITHSAIFAPLEQVASDLHGTHPIAFYAASIAALIFPIVLILLEYFKPVGKRRLKNGQKPKLPPGPWGVPLFGNLLKLKGARSDPDQKWLRGLVRHGEMATAHVGSKTIVFLNSKRVVSEIIAKRGGATNTQSPMPMASGVVSHGHRRSLLMTQEKWAEPLPVMHTLLSGTALKQYGEWHHYRYANSVVHRIALGERLAKSTKDLEDLQNLVTIFVTIFVTTTGSSPWRAHWEKLDRWNYDVYPSWWAPVLEQIRRGTAPPSFARDTLLHGDTKYTGSDDDAMYVAMQLIEAGSDTTREALHIMADVDGVCSVGADARLPTLADMDALRYVCATAKELLRWRPIFVITPDHVASQDIEFEGYHFPAGTGFVINAVVVGDECDSPETFDPDRWMDGHETDIAHGLWQFGGGRRICVGYRLAQRSMFISIARLVQCLTSSLRYNSRILNLEATEEPFLVKVYVRG